MVEVFTTNVIYAQDAQKIINQIHENFNHYQANFALDDCDKILRINCSDGLITAAGVIALVESMGFKASILPDDLGNDLYASASENRDMNLI